jgi:hypothetical protein
LESPEPLDLLSQPHQTATPAQPAEFTSLVAAETNDASSVEQNESTSPAEPTPPALSAKDSTPEPIHPASHSKPASPAMPSASPSPAPSAEQAKPAEPEKQTSETLDVPASPIEQSYTATTGTQRASDTPPTAALLPVTPAPDGSPLLGTPPIMTTTKTWSDKDAIFFFMDEGGQKVCKFCKYVRLTFCFASRMLISVQKTPGEASRPPR